MNIVKIKNGSELINDTFKSIFNSPLFNNPEFPRSASTYTPKVRISKDRDQFTISMELPGVSKEEVKLSVENNVLSVSGEKNQVNKTEDTNLIMNEIYYGQFSRNFNLSKDIKVDAIDAEYNDGVLNITLPKIEEAKPIVKEISIK